jgi:hypothetical protein
MNKNHAALMLSVSVVMHLIDRGMLDSKVKHSRVKSVVFIFDVVNFAFQYTTNSNVATLCDVYSL